MFNDRTSRILLVEDDAAHVDLIRQSFESYSGQVELTVAGTLGEARARTSQSPPDLMITDLVLPDGRGTQLLPADKQQAPFPIVVMTSFGDEQAAVDAMKAGALDYVVKTKATFAEMPHIAERAMRQWKHILRRRQAEQALQKAHEDLERRVEQRTAELALLNRELEREVEQRKKTEEALHAEKRGLRRMLEMQDRDRRLITYEIHDGLTQQLTAANMQFQAFEQLFSTDRDASLDVFHAGLRLLGQGLAEARRIISGLRPPILDESGIVAAIEHLVCDRGDSHDPRIEFNADVQFDRLQPVLENSLFRIVQESLANARQHSKSDKVHVSMVQSNNHVRLEIRDWGKGFNPDSVQEHCFGLKGIRERARLLQGKATINSTPGQGTHIIVELPLIEPD
ncbi:MAG: response regulator [Thermoguttaceae bacterium]